MKYLQWTDFVPGKWSEDEINVRDFIQRNYAPYEGDGSFLAPATENTKKLWKEICDLSEKERAAGGVLSADTKIVSSVNSHEAGYIDKDIEKSSDFRRTNRSSALCTFPADSEWLNKPSRFTVIKSTRPFTIFIKIQKDAQRRGVRRLHARNAPRAHGAHPHRTARRLRQRQNRWRLQAYRPLRRRLSDCKENEDKRLIDGDMIPDKVRDREEISEQIKALEALKQMALKYGFDISRPAENAQEAIQWLYFGYLGAVKDQNGAAMSIGRNTAFLDIYIERDIKKGLLTELEAQELIDHFVMKLRIVKFMRTKEYNELFSGDPTWVTESIGGMGTDGRPLVTRTSMRMLHTLVNLGPAPEPNLTVLWSENLPENFKKFCADISLKTSAIQYESDDLMRPEMGDDYCIACCVSSMRVGKDMQFFGARANIAKCLLYAINGGKDELCKDKETGKPLQVSPEFAPITGDGPLDYNEVIKNTII